MAPSARGRPAPASDPDPETVPIISEADAFEAPADPTVCPRCRGKLTNPDGLGWCPGCGYCRSIEEEEKVIASAPPPPAPKQPSALGATEFGEAMRRMPSWAWPLLGGAALVAGVSTVGNYLLPEECFARALWSAVQIVVSVIGLITAQLWVVLLVGAHEDKLGAKDVILAGRVWPAACRRLPATRKPVWLGAWSLTGLVCGFAVIGGFNYWLEAMKAGRVRHLAERMAGEAAMKHTGREAMDLTELPPPVPPPAADKDAITQCAVIGYQTDGKTVTGIVLAMADGDHLQFAGVVREGLSAVLRRDLMSRLSRLGRKEPLIPGLTMKGTVWVNPGVFCDVIRPGKAKEGEEPAFQGLRD